MRAPIEIDASLLLRLEAEARKTGQAVVDLLEALLRRSLDDLPKEVPQERPRFVVKPRALHALPGVDFTSTSRLLDSLGEERFPG